MPDSRMLSFWILHLAFRVVELQTSLGSLHFDSLLLELKKDNHTLRDFVIYQEEMILMLLGLYYCTVALLQLNCRNKSEIIQHSQVFKNCYIISRPTSFYKKFVLLVVLCVFTVSVLFPTYATASKL